jgi:hypothetical protein
MTAAQTLEVVHGLINNMAIVMEGTKHYFMVMRVILNGFWVDGNASTEGIRQALGTPTSRRM